MRADEQTDMTKLIVAFRNFADVPEKKCGNYAENIRSHRKTLIARATRRVGLADRESCRAEM
jgi:hypothetical protein